MTANSAGAPKYKRRLVNFLLQPVVQLRVGFINVSLSLVFVVGLGWYVYAKLIQFADVVATLTEADSEVSGLLAGYLSSVGLTAAACGLLFVLVSLGASIYVTHKMVGPTIAFRRHIRGLMSGNFSVKTRLRKGDAFTEVADDLNSLSDKLGEMLRR